MKLSSASVAALVGLLGLIDATLESPVPREDLAVDLKSAEISESRTEGPVSGSINGTAIAFNGTKGDTTASLKGYKYRMHVTGGDRTLDKEELKGAIRVEKGEDEYWAKMRQSNVSAVDGEDHFNRESKVAKAGANIDDDEYRLGVAMVTSDKLEDGKSEKVDSNGLYLSEVSDEQTMKAEVIAGDYASADDSHTLEASAFGYNITRTKDNEYLHREKKVIKIKAKYYDIEDELDEADQKLTKLEAAAAASNGTVATYQKRAANSTAVAETEQEPEQPLVLTLVMEIHTKTEKDISSLREMEGNDGAHDDCEELDGRLQRQKERIQRLRAKGPKGHRAGIESKMASEKAAVDEKVAAAANAAPEV
ncbi:hypothetical protein W97_06562 [Coniosporium apollinis CBS 100218]|uniref:Uncharacterized protein n=1 Tax=Coniosporium apollinis (strain CBS 100218) TaxID=1168221 RepID=R7YZT8_CONA1|nr:uncharacterized protein W97_06562 [Coniosporium apollinis CBS 100218]EON67309.1 hypothetical protein W97_06562 [Coniosporium apollinis CBS 100218]